MFVVTRCNILLKLVLFRHHKNNSLCYHTTYMQCICIAWYVLSYVHPSVTLQYCTEKAEGVELVFQHRSYSEGSR